MTQDGRQVLLLQRRHAIHKDRYHHLVEAQGERNFHGHEIVRPAKAAAFFIFEPKPFLANHDKKDATGPDLLLKRLREIVRGAELFDIHEKPVFAKHALQLIE